MGTRLGASFEKNGVKEWVAIVVTNWQGAKCERGEEVQESCILSE